MHLRPSTDARAIWRMALALPEIRVPQGMIRRNWKIFIPSVSEAFPPFGIFVCIAEADFPLGGEEETFDKKGRSG